MSEFKDWKIGETYSTRGGVTRKVVAKCPDGRLVVEDSYHVLGYRDENGKANAARSSADLIPPKERREFWLNVYPGVVGTATRESEEEANAHADSARIGKAVRVVLEQDEHGNFQVVKDCQDDR